MSGFTKDSIPTRSGMDSSSLVDSFDRKSSSKAQSSRDDPGELSKIDAEVRKQLDIGNEDVMVSILQEPAFDFDAAAKAREVDKSKPEPTVSGFSMKSASKEDLTADARSDSEFGNDRDSSLAASKAHVQALRGAFDGSVKP